MKKLLCLLLALTMLTAMLAGCASNEAAPAQQESSAPAVEESAPVEEEAPAPEEEAPAVEEVPEEPAEPEVELLALPLDETATITIWDVFPPPLAGFMDGPWDCSANPVLEEACNIKFEYTVASTETASEMFNLMVVAGDYCDFIYGINTYYTTGTDMAVNDEIVIDHLEMAQTLPNFMKLWDAYPDAVELTTEGYLAYFPQIITERFNERLQGPATRGDWVDQLGIELPETHDELYEMLKAFHTEFGATGGYLLSSDGFSADLASGLNASSGFYQVDGVVKYGPLEEGYKKYCEYINKLYSESLVPKDFYTMQGAPTDSITSTDVTCWSSDVGMWKYFTSGITSEDYYTIGFTVPVENKGDVPHFNSAQTGASTEGLSISTDCEQLDVMAAVINYMYSDEFALVANYGVEGEGLVYDEAGNPHLSDLILNNQETIMSFAIKKYTAFTYFPCQSIETRNMDAYDEVQVQTMEMWSNFGDDLYVYPSEISLSAEDTETTAMILTDVETLIDEYLLGFITGSINLDKYEEFRQNIIDLDIQTVIDIYQRYYDEYTA